jgi:hypothetical protein
MADVPLSWPLRPASHGPLGCIEAAWQGTQTSSVCVGRREFAGATALTRDRPPSDVRLGRSMVTMMI